MTHKEINDALEGHKTPKWFNELSHIFDYPHLNYKIEKTGFSSIYQYIERQCKNWEKVKGSGATEIEASRNTYKKILNSLDNFIQNSLEWDQQQLNQQWRNDPLLIINRLKDQNLFPVDHSMTSFLIHQHNVSSEHYSGAYEYLVRARSSFNINSPRQLEGMISAYEFKNSETSKISKRSRYEKGALTKLQGNLENYLNKLSVETDLFLNQNKSKTKEFTKHVEDLKLTKQREFENWFEETKATQIAFSDDSNSALKNLESLYNEKLMLEAPAQYWNKRAKSLRKEGMNWVFAFATCTVLSIISLVIVLYFMSNGTLLEIFSKTGSAIRWSIVFITLISFLAFGVRTFIKLAFSSFHLVRDAEEREQLVYVYLSLKEGVALQNEERILVLQSIFSRADSGLLREDSSPTMPGSSSILDRIMSR